MSVKLIRASRFLIFAFLTSVCSTSNARWTEDDTAKPPTDPVEVLSIQSILVDTNGQPIQDVAATVFGLRCLEDKGSWYGWPSNNIGEVQDSKSRADGGIDFRYPVKYGVPEKWLTTSTLDITLIHPEFVPHRLEISLEKVPEKIVLTSGCKVTFSAIDENGTAIDRLFPMVPGLAFAPKWEFTKGSARSGGLPASKHMCMLASPNSTGTRFSKLFQFETTLDREVSIPNIIVRPGRRVFGKLPTNVPRPIVDGSVSIEVIMEGDEPLGGAKPVGWSDWCTIAEDGSFEFNSVPDPSQVQVIAICRGWLIQSLDKNNNRVSGKTFDLKKEHSELEVDFEMEQTGNVRIELMTTDGESVTGAKVSTWPNKVNLSGGSRTLANLWRTTDYLEALFKGERTRAFRESPLNRHHQISDSEGVVTLFDIPAGMHESINVQHPLYDLPYEIGTVRNDVKYRVNAGETVERLLILQKRESAK